MNKKIAIVAAAAIIMLTGCSSFEGTVSKKVETFEDAHGRVCTVVKWSETGGIDCDFKP